MCNVEEKIRNCGRVPWFNPGFYFLFLLRLAAVEPGMMALCAFAGKAREVAADAHNFLSFLTHAHFLTPASARCSLHHLIQRMCGLNIFGPYVVIENIRTFFVETCCDSRALKRLT